MILELNGIPGTGKTSTIDKLSKELSKRHITHKCICVEDFRRTDVKNPYRYLILFDRCIHFLIPAILVVFFEVDRKNNCYLKLKDLIVTTMYLLYLRKEYQKDNVSVSLTDEGIVQTLANLNINEDTKIFHQCANILKDRNVLCVGLDISIEEAYLRIHNRGRKVSSTDYLNEVETKKYLEYLSNYLEKVRHYMRLRNVKMRTVKQNESLWNLYQEEERA